MIHRLSPSGVILTDSSNFSIVAAFTALGGGITLSGSPQIIIDTGGAVVKAGDTVVAFGESRLQNGSATPATVSFFIQIAAVASVFRFVNSGIEGNEDMLFPYSGVTAPGQVTMDSSIQLLASQDASQTTVSIPASEASLSLMVLRPQTSP